jgi:hypothetical protein
MVLKAAHALVHTSDKPYTRPTPVILSVASAIDYSLVTTTDTSAPVTVRLEIAQ